jgi:uncharacterized protein YecE (DUF72 family)
MQFFVGTSGYGYKEWKGSFYPEKLSQKKMLPYYGERFSTVEINYTFRRTPSESTLQSWAQQVPEGFRFSLKAPQRITHIKRLNDAEAELQTFLAAAQTLKHRQGPLLFQLPPEFKKDLHRLDAFLQMLGKQAKVAFEFRHESWLDDEVYACLKQHACALCVADADDLPAPKQLGVGTWLYLRLRRDSYSDQELRDWVAKLKSQKCTEAYIYFKHEDTGAGPKLAARLNKLIART